MDQFAFRDRFRSLKAYSELFVFHKNDVNDLYLYDGHLIKRVDRYRPESIKHFTEYINALTSRYLGESDVYYAVIPDKNYFVQDDDYRIIDYAQLVSSINEAAMDMTYIDLFSTLTLDDYYRNDTHWRQDYLSETVNLIADKMNFLTDISETNYIIHTYEDFSGVYSGQSALNPAPEELFYLESPSTKEAIVVNYQYPDKECHVYETELLDKMDSYDVFLGGATPLVTVTNPNSTSEKELIMFRDSFGSSLAPLLIEEYRTITLVDTRYMSSDLLGEYIDFNGQDVLFIYNTEVINNSQMLR